MARAMTATTAFSSTAIRVLSYIFFRWVTNFSSLLRTMLICELQMPGHHFPPLIYAFTMIYYITILLPEEAAPAVRVDGRGHFVSNGTVLKEKKEEVKTKAGQERGKDGAGDTRVQAKRTGDNDEGETDIWRRVKTWVLGVPASRSMVTNVAAAAINLLLVLGTLDVVFRGSVLYPSNDLSFARVGYVSETTAKILVREPDTKQLPIYLSYWATPKSGLDISWKAAGSIATLSNDTDYTSTLTITRLRPSTAYQYAVSTNQTGTFMTAPRPGDIANKKFTFLTSSCIKPAFPYNPLGHPLSIPGLRHLAAQLPALSAQFMLFLGDFIYIDVPHRHGRTPETYRSEYRRVYSSPDWPAASKSLPWLHVIDDHEIANDWDRGWEDPYPAAIDPWDIYHASVNPPPAEPNASYFSFIQGPAAFFMLDTRRHRDPSSDLNATDPAKTMLGAAQLASLLRFLKRDEAKGVQWKFVISSIPFTRNWRLNAADTWGGYLHERRTILEAMWDVSIQHPGTGVVVLSGDRHEFAATAFPPPEGERWGKEATVHEFSTSPLSMFYLPIRSYWENEGEWGDGYGRDVCVAYRPDGQSKFGAVELGSVVGGEQGTLRFRLFVDGVETWEHVLLTAGGDGGRARDAFWG